MNTNKKVWIMNAKGVQLESILKDFCSEIDNLIQLAADAGDDDIASFFEKAYTNIEFYLFKVKDEKRLSAKERNDIRCDMKICFKQGGFYC